MLRDFIDLGLTFENCEPWFERGVFAFMVILVVITVIRVSKIRLNRALPQEYLIISAASFRVDFIGLLYHSCPPPRLLFVIAHT